MSIDDRARAAATDLLERAADRPVPPVQQLEMSRRRSVRPLLAAVAAVVLAVVGVAVIASPDDDATSAMPGGGRSRTWAPAGLGLSVQIPASWPDRGPGAGFSYTAMPAGGDGSIVADRLPLLRALDVGDVAVARAADLQAFGAIEIEEATTVVDGRPAARLRYRLRFPEEPSVLYAVTEYDIPVGGWLIIVAVGEREPADRSELTDWIRSTIEVRDLTEADTALRSPAVQPDRPLPVPDGVEPAAWTPEGFDVTLQVPSSWQEQGPDGSPYRQIFPVGGGPAASVMAMSPIDASDRVEDIEYEGGLVESATDTLVDGHPTRVLRYWQAPAGYPLRVTLTLEYLIERDDDVLVVRTDEHAGGEDHAELLRWIRSTIDLV